MVAAIATTVTTARSPWNSMGESNCFRVESIKCLRWKYFSLKSLPIFRKIYN